MVFLIMGGHYQSSSPRAFTFKLQVGSTPLVLDRLVTRSYLPRRLHIQHPDPSVQRSSALTG